MATRRSKPAKTPAGEAPAIPERIYAVASPRSVGGVSLFEAQWQINSTTVQNFLSEQDVINRAVARLQQAGFEVLQVTATTINICGTAATYEQAFSTKIIAEERPVIKSLGEETTATFLDTPGTDHLPGLISTSGTAFADVLEGVAIEEPRYYMAASMFAPLKSYWHLRVPGDVSLGCNADRAHRTGVTGKGINVAIVDSGWFKHPFFVGRGYRSAPVALGPGTANPLKDENGHGTGESANIFAVAPDVNLMPVKMNFANTVGAFNAAVGLGPDIITCSWGSSKQSGPLSAADQALAAAIAVAVASGICVIFAAGNGQWGFPGQHPDVISAGGVFMNPNGSLRASDYASGFMSNIYAGRRVPDLSGLVGMQPKAAYIMLPLEPGCEIDQGRAGQTHPNGDETANNDGWAAFSGTSAAAPQLAGAAALIKQVCPGLKPAQVRDILMRSARDVTAGNCHPSTGGNAAVVGPDTATGNGLVDAHKAVLLAKVRCSTRPPILPPGTPPIVVAPPFPQPFPPPFPPTIVAPPFPPPVPPTIVAPPFPQPFPPPVPPSVGPVPPSVGPVPPSVGPVPPSVGPVPPIGPASEPQVAGSSSVQLSSEDVQALEEMIIDEELDDQQLGL